MELITLLVGLASLTVGLTAANTETTEMSELVYEEQLPSGLYPGNVYRTKLYLQPGIKWLRINLQQDVGNPLVDRKEVAMAIHINIDPIDNTMGSIERNWYDITGTSQLAQPDRLIYGEFPFHEDYVFEIIVTCLLDYYQVQVNGYEKFTFDHPTTTGILPDFDIIRIMASPGTVDLCWHKFNQDYIPINETNPRCNQPVVKSICDDLVCYIFSDTNNMYTSTANPITMATAPVTLSQDVLTSLGEMAEQFCCLEGLIKDINGENGQETFQLAVDISTELLTWQGNASWDNVNKISKNGPLSLFDRLDDVAQVIAKNLDVGTSLTADTPAVSCSLEANTLDAFVQKDWSFKPSEDNEDEISIKGTDLANLGFNSSDIKLVIFGAALTNLTEFINYNQQGVQEFIVADIISATLFGPDGQVSVPTTFSRRLSDITDTNSTEPREPVCAFWSDFFKGSISGGWSTQGCTRIDKDYQTNVAEGDYVTCHCNHTTNYAILMRIVPREEKSTETSQLKILDVLTFIGCIVSILVLLLALSFFIFMKHSTLDTERIMIHRHLMGSLLIAMVTFLISTFLTNEMIPCKIIAALLHYLYLVVFCWMFVEGVHLYRLIVTVYGSEKQMAKIYYSIGWGVPLLIVGISAAVKWTGYGVPGVACWLNPSHGFIWAFVGPACLIMLMNFVVLFLVVKTTVTMSKTYSPDNLAKAKTGLRSSLVLLPMLGITWTIGLIVHLHTALVFIFVILNSFQGLWLVIVCCLLNGEVRTAFKHVFNKKFSRFSPTVDVTSSSGPAVTGTTSKNPNPRATSKDLDTKMTDVD